MGTNEWYKDGLFWRERSAKWECVNYGECPNGKGDLVSNTVIHIFETNDTSAWARKSLDAMTELLLASKRWPDRMNQFIDAENMFEWRLSKLLQEDGVDETVLFRPQIHNTRDPFIYFYCLCVKFGRYDLIEKVKLPLNCFRIGIWAWRECLYNETWFSRLLYREKGTHKLDYVNKLREFRKWAYDNKE